LKLHALAQNHNLLLRKPTTHLFLLGMRPCGPSSAWLPTRAACHHSSLLPFRMWRMSPCLKVSPWEGRSSSLLES